MKQSQVPWARRSSKTDASFGSQRQFTNRSPYETSNWFTRLFFFYTYPLFYKAIKNRGLELSDVPQCPKSDEVQYLTARVMKYWQVECRRSEKNGDLRPRLWVAMLKAFGPLVVLPVLLLMINECILVVIQPLLLGKVIQYFNGDPTISRPGAYLYAGGIVAILATMVMLLHSIMIFMDRFAMRARSVCCSIIYLKSLKLSRAALQETEVGQIINMMSNDVKRFDDFGFFSSYLIVAPVQMVIIVTVLWQYLNIAILPGAAILVLLIPFQYMMGAFFGRVRKKASILTDIRLRYMSEIIAGMRVLKMYTWETPFARRVVDSRSAEIAKIRIACILKGINLSVFFVASRTILFVCFVTYVLLGYPLTSDVVFVTMAWLNQIRLTMTLFFPSAVSLVGELKVTLAKIQKFLLLSEVQQLPEEENKLTNGSTAVCERNKDSNINNNNNNNKTESEVEIVPKASHVVIDKITASWNASQTVPTLDNISVDLRPGDLLAIVGAVGAGKSSLLMALLHELPLTSGRIDISGVLSYAGQEAWNFNRSIRENILFGQPMDFGRYQKTVKVCALERDFELLPAGDSTLVGERGVSLSGGQRARINLARAIYRQAECYLLDDPLSALDASVSKFIFENCLLEHLHDKITILVTHQIQFVERATKILVLNRGKCEAYGSYQELRSSGVNFIELLKEGEEEEEGGETKEAREAREALTSESALFQSLNRGTSNWSLDTLCTDRMATPQIPLDDKFLDTTPQLSRLSLRSSVSEKRGEKYNELDLEKHDKEQQVLFLPKSDDEQQLPVQEGIEKGELSAQVYIEYLKAGSGALLFTVMLISTFISQFVCQGTDIFLTQWTNGQTGSLSQNYVILIYGSLIIALFISTIIRAVSFFDICMRASKNLHRNIFSRLIKTPIKFFEVNPLGRILNRFSKDLGSIDENFPYVAFDLNLVFLSAVGIIIAAAYVSVWFLLPGFVYMLIIIKIRAYYIIAALDIKRFEAYARSPIYSHLSTTISGLSSIRAFGEEVAFVKTFFDHLNDHCSTWFLYISSSRALGVLIDWCCIVFNAIIIVVLMALPKESIPGGDAGLAISSGLALTGMIQWGVRQSAEFVSQMSSVERIIEYQKLEQEVTPRLDEANEKKALSKEWPEVGEISFDKMCLTYDKLPTGSEEKKVKNVLNNITVSIEGSSRIAIVGRTGSGKSSLLAALFRLSESHSGSIAIDGIDIQTITHETLRRKLSIIPQEPAIFSGTVRFNLDPFEEYSDAEIWEALEKSQLKTAVENMSEKLASQLNENGGNLSVGQRQLICLARAILRKSKILILDEATANVDPTTDQTIQENIRKHFTDSTVLTIAHRLSTIIDFDKILVLDAGEVQEFDTPWKLICKRGMFWQMCENTGEEMCRQLVATAKKHYQAKKPVGEPVDGPESSSGEEDAGER